MPAAPSYIDEDDVEHELPFNWVICGTCSGHGKSSAYLGAFTADQMHEDPDFSEDYRAGFYDRTCDECGGAGKTKVVDERRTPKAALREYRNQQRELAQCNAIERQERLMEGGWREEGWY